MLQAREEYIVGVMRDSSIEDLPCDGACLIHCSEWIVDSHSL
jgi:hypothetical protein